jgi:hypothetical protein
MRRFTILQCLKVILAASVACLISGSPRQLKDMSEWSDSMSENRYVYLSDCRELLLTYIHLLQLQCRGEETALSVWSPKLRSSGPSRVGCSYADFVMTINWKQIFITFKNPEAACITESSL